MRLAAAVDLPEKNDPRHRSLMMSETELLAIGRGTTEHLVTWFGQMLTITFAMIVAIYYFLKDARLSLKIFTFFAYTLGMTVLLGVMLVESNIKLGATEALERIPKDQVSVPTAYYLALSHSWMSTVVSITSICPSGCYGLVCFICFS
jgi:hypothetical protein